MDRWLNRMTGSLLFFIPLLPLVLLFSDSWFSIYYSSIRPVSDSGGPLLIGRGSWYVVALVNSYMFNLMGMAVLILCAFQVRNLYRRQTLALIGAVLIPILVNIFYQVAPVLFPSISIRVDLTPISFTLSAALIAVGVFGLQIFDLMPIARYTVMEHIPEIVFVVDSHNRVLDVNFAPYEDMKFVTTFSAGVATFPDHGLSGEGILQAADKALYFSKNSGRNRVTMFVKS